MGDRKKPTPPPNEEVRDGSTRRVAKPDPPPPPPKKKCHLEARVARLERLMVGGFRWSPRCHPEYTDDFQERTYGELQELIREVEPKKEGGAENGAA